MMKELAELIVDAGQYHGCDDLELYEDYSGRGMYGATTTGIRAGSLTDVIAAAYYAGVAVGEGEEAGADPFPRLRSDSLGLGVIVY